ncbi:MAG: FAD:protein FMN transferase [Patescibacteria group bacterium]|nr:FAD:protein FMN transferase [Patescibacteria group bacterium]
MKETRVIMGMPIAVEVADSGLQESDLENVFDYFRYIDGKFSTYKEESEISKINRGELAPDEYSEDMEKVFFLAEEMKRMTGGFFDIATPGGRIDPSGLVKGWAIHNAANILERKGAENFYINAGGDVQVRGKNAAGRNWMIGVKNPFRQEEIIKVLSVENGGAATSGTYIRGRHIYNPKKPADSLADVVSLTVIGPDIYEADCLATAAFAMGKEGIRFIESLSGFEGLSIDRQGMATMTSGLSKYNV